jgi:hypothetical protein
LQKKTTTSTRPARACANSERSTSQNLKTLKP